MKVLKTGIKDGVFHVHEGDRVTTPAGVFEIAFTPVRLFIKDGIPCRKPVSRSQDMIPLRRIEEDEEIKQ